MFVTTKSLFVMDRLFVTKVTQKFLTKKKNVCHDNIFVVTKMILVAAPTSDKISVLHITISCGNINKNNKQMNKK